MNTWGRMQSSLTAIDPLFDRAAMWRAIDEANERWEREAWEATLAAIKALPVVSHA